MDKIFRSKISLKNLDEIYAIYDYFKWYNFWIEIMIFPPLQDTMLLPLHKL